MQFRILNRPQIVPIFYAVSRSSYLYYFEIQGFLLKKPFGQQESEDEKERKDPQESAFFVF